MHNFFTTVNRRRIEPPVPLFHEGKIIAIKKTGHHVSLFLVIFTIINSSYNSAHRTPLVASLD